MRVRGRLTTIPDGLAVPDGTTGEVRLRSDNSLIATVSTTNGWYGYSQDGNPGPISITWDYAGTVHDKYSEITGPSGPVDLPGLPFVFRTFGNGYISGVGGQLAVTAAGSSMNVSVASGAALTQGILYDQENARSVTIPAADATLPRIDRVVVRVVPAGAGPTVEGRSELAVLTGTPVTGASPTNEAHLPAMTQTTALWEEEIARVTVGAGVIVIGSDKVTDARSAISMLPGVGEVTTEMLADNAVTTPKITNLGVTTDKIANFNVTSDKIQGSAVTTTKIANASVTLPKLDNDAKSLYVVKSNETTVGGTDVNRLNFNSPFTVAVDGTFTNQRDIGINSVSALMPGTEYVATGALSTGTRTLVTMAVGPLVSGVQYAIQVDHGVTLRNDGNTGTVIVRANINGGTQRTHEYQSVGNVPRWAPVKQSATVTGAGTTINVTGSVVYSSGDATSIRAGEISVIAIPLNVVSG